MMENSHPHYLWITFRARSPSRGILIQVSPESSLL